HLALPRGISFGIMPSCMEVAQTICKTKSRKSASTHKACVGSFSFKDERRRFNVLVEGVRRARKATLGVDTVVEFHRDIEHHQIGGGDASARPGFEQRARRGVRPGRPGRGLPAQTSPGHSKTCP